MTDHFANESSAFQEEDCESNTSSLRTNTIEKARVMISTPVRRFPSSTSTPINQLQHQNQNRSQQQTPNSSSSALISRSTPSNSTPSNGLGFLSTSRTASPANALLNSNLNNNSGLRNRMNGTGNQSAAASASASRLAALSTSAPPASALQRLPYADYTDLIKTVLRLRLRRIYLLSFLSTHSLLCLSFFSPLSPISSLLHFISPTTLLITFLTWSFSVLPLLVLRKWDIQGKNSSTSSNQTRTSQNKIPLIVKPAKNSPLEYWQSRISSSLDRHSLAHILSGLILSLSFTLTLSHFDSLNEENETGDWNFWSLIDYKDGDQLWKPNEGVFSLIFINSILGLIYVLSSSLSLKSVQPYSSPPTFTSSSTTTTLRDRFMTLSSRSFLPSIINSSISYGSLLILYSLARWYLSDTILSIVGEDSFLGSYLLPDFNETFFSLELIVRSIILAISTGLIWKISVDCLWEIYSTQPVLVSEFGKERTRGLIGGLKARSTNKPKSNNGGGGDKEAFFLSNYAFAELSLLTSSSVERRKEIYQDVGTSSISVSGSPMSNILANSLNGNGRESAWKSILKECLDVLKDEIESVKSGGKLIPENQDQVQKQGSNSQSSSSAGLNTFNTPSPGRNLEVTDAEQLKKAIKTPKPDFWDTISASPQSSTSTSNQSTNLLEKKVGQLLPKSVTSLIGFNSSSSTSKPSSTSTPSSAKPNTPSTPKSNQPQFSTFSKSILAFSLSFYHLLHSDLIHVSAKPLTPIFNFFYQILHSNQSLVLKTDLSNPQNSASLIWSIESLTDLSINSLNEDQLGMVQRDLIGIMESFADLLIAVNDRMNGLIKELKEQEEERMKLVERVFPKEKNGEVSDENSTNLLKEFREDYLNHSLELIMALRNGLVRIGTTFDHFVLPGDNDLIREKIEKALALPIGVEAVQG